MWMRILLKMFPLYLEWHPVTKQTLDKYLLKK